MYSVYLQENDLTVSNRIKFKNLTSHFILTRSNYYFFSSTNCNPSIYYNFYDFAQCFEHSNHKSLLTLSHMKVSLLISGNIFMVTLIMNCRVPCSNHLQISSEKLMCNQNTSEGGPGLNLLFVAPVFYN